MSDTQPVDLQPAEEPDAPSAGFDPSPAMRWLLATLSFGAGAIHLVMVPQHAQESMRMGVAFAIAGWIQIAFGAAMLSKTKRVWVQLSIIANLVFIAAWALSRTVGLPAFTGDAGVEKAGSVDVLCVAFEGVLVIGSIALLVAPDMLKKLKQPALIAGAILPVAILVGTTAVLASPSAANHSHGGGDDHTNLASGGHGHADAMDHNNMDHSATGPMDHNNMDHAAGSHDHPAANAVNAAERCDWDMNTQSYWKQNPPAMDGASHEHSHAEGAKAEGGAGTGQGNGHGAQAWTPITDKAKCDELKGDIKKMEEVAAKYPTAQDAMNAGCFRVTIFVEGIAAHYMCPKNFQNTPTIDKPEMILYGGSQPWAPVVGLSYYSLAKSNPADDANADIWVKYMPRHFHEGLCIKGTLVIGGDNTDKAKCESQGGKIQGRTGYMGHYWLNSCDSPDGVFSADNPRLDIGVANVNDDPANAADPAKLQKNPCAGSKLASAPGTGSFGPPTSVDTKKGESAAGK